MAAACGLMELRRRWSKVALLWILPPLRLSSEQHNCEANKEEGQEIVFGYGC